MKSSYTKYLSSLVLFGFNGIIASFIALSSIQITVMRTFLGALLLLILVLLTKRRLLHTTAQRDYLFILTSGCCMGASWMFQYEAFVRIGVGITSLIYCLGPVLLVALSPLIFQEKVTLKRLTCFALALIGILLINSQATSTDSDPFGFICALLCALCYTGFIVLNKQATVVRGIDNAAFQLCGACAVSFVCALFVHEIPFCIPQESILPLLVLGVISTGVGCFLYFSGIGSLPAQTVAICDYLEPLLAVVLAGIILQETLTTLQVVGGCFIIVGALGSELSRKTNYSASSKRT